MTVEEHYRELLGLPQPWEVTKVERDPLGQRVTVWLGWPDRVKAPCPVCGERMPVYDRMDERSWRHLSVMQYRLELRCAMPRCRCEEHGVKTIKAPWAEPRSRFSVHFEGFACQSHRGVPLAESSRRAARSALGQRATYH